MGATAAFDATAVVAVAAPSTPSTPPWGLRHRAKWLDYLEASGDRPVRALQRLLALLPGSARLPQTREGEAGLCVDRLEFARDGRAVEFCSPCLRGDIHDFVAELNAGKGSVGGSSRPHDNQLRQR